MRLRHKPDTQIVLGSRKLRHVGKRGHNRGTFMSRKWALKKVPPVSDAQFVCDAASPSADPTGTLKLNRRFSSLLMFRYRRIEMVLRRAIVQQDILGIKPGSMSPLALAAGPGGQQLGFQSWFDNLLSTIVAEDGSWMRTFVAQAYMIGLKRAIRLTGKAQAVPDSMRDQVKVLTTLALTELQGVNEAVSQRVMRIASNAILGKGDPKRVLSEMLQAVRQVGINRSRAMSAMVLVKTHATATLDLLEQAGHTHVYLVPELKPIRDAEGPGSRSGRKAEGPSARTIRRIRAVQRKLERTQMVNVATAGDKKVCPICEGIEEDGPYTINQARTLIPAHPQCRCAFVPVDVEPDEFSGEEVIDDYNPDQPRVPAGDPDGGQWSGEGGGSGGGSEDDIEKALEADGWTKKIKGDFEVYTNPKFRKASDDKGPFYHETPARNVEAIKSEGIRPTPGTGFQQSHPNAPKDLGGDVWVNNKETFKETDKSYFRREDVAFEVYGRVKRDEGDRGMVLEGRIRPEQIKAIYRIRAK